jgi:hypothetical protein
MLSQPLTISVLVLLVASVTAAQDTTTYADARARDLLQRARTAVAPDGMLQGLRSLALKGRLRIPGEGVESSDGTVEIKILLPDRYLRIDRLGDVEKRYGSGPGVTATTPGDQQRARIQFVTWMLGALGSLVEPRMVARSVADAGQADTAAVDVTAPGLSLRLVLDMPALIPMRIVNFGERSATTVISFANRRSTDGFELPSRVTTQTADRVLETLMFDEMFVNPALSETDFRK